MKISDYDDAVAITREIFWVGFYDQEAHLHCNPYLLIDDEDVVLFDPGSIPHFPIVMRKVIDLVNPRSISLIIASHQDPDICGNLAVVEDVIDNADLKIAAHSNSIRLIHHYGIHSSFYAVDNQNYRITLKSGRVLDFIFTPYLHSPGAIMTYDSKSKTLFSSDIFGAVSKDWDLFAGDKYPDYMTPFHQRYMPGNHILKKCMDSLATLDIQRICPQHGSVLEGKYITQAIEFLKNLPCGIDLEQG